MQYSEQTSPHDSPMGHLPGTHGAFHLQEVGNGWAHLKPVRADRPLHRTKAVRVWVPAQHAGLLVPGVEVSPRRALHRGRVGLSLWMRPCPGGLDHWLVFSWIPGEMPPHPPEVVKQLKRTEPLPWDLIPFGDLDLTAGLKDNRLRFLNIQISSPVRERMDALLGQPLTSQLFRPRRVPWALRSVSPHHYQLWVGL